MTFAGANPSFATCNEGSPMISVDGCARFIRHAVADTADELRNFVDQLLSLRLIVGHAQLGQQVLGPHRPTGGLYD